MNKAAATFVSRKTFKFPPIQLTNWFPGHMHKGMLQMKAKLRSIDCVLEVHDARIPLTGRNPVLDNKFSICPQILLFNKSDLIAQEHRKLILNSIEGTGGMEGEGEKRVLFTNCLRQKDPGVRMILPTVIELIKNSDRGLREEEPSFQIMVVGIPNVGKSSLINILRVLNTQKGYAAHVGALAGVTRSVMEKIRVCDEPTIYLRDTPGISVPTIKEKEVILKLALCGNVDDKLVNKELMADYLLFWMNKHKNFSYVEYLGLTEPCDDIKEVLLRTAIHHKFIFQKRDKSHKLINWPDCARSAEYFIAGFRKAVFGPICLDVDLLF